jgi:hypothetical protein
MVARWVRSGMQLTFQPDHTKMISTGVGRSSGFVPSCKARLSLIEFPIEVFATHPQIYRYLRFPYKDLWRMALREDNFRDELSVEKPRQYPYPCRLGRAHARLGLSQLRWFRG